MCACRKHDGKLLAQQLMSWHMANLEFANAAEVHTLSLSQWDQDDAHELLGAHCFLPGALGTAGAART